MITRRKDLEIAISRLRRFRSPKLELEQYVTPPPIVADIVWIAETVFSDVTGRVVYEPGCGTAPFSIAAALLGAKQCVCVELDRDAAEVARENVALSNTECTVNVIIGDSLEPPVTKVDVAFQNPPFGIWSRRHSDRDFLLATLKVAKVVYTIHKTSSVEYIEELVRSMGYNVIRLGRYRLPIFQMYPHHRSRRRDIDVTVLRVWK